MTFRNPSGVLCRVLVFKSKSELNTQALEPHTSCATLGEMLLLSGPTTRAKCYALGKHIQKSGRRLTHQRHHKILLINTSKKLGNMRGNKKKEA